MIGCSLPNHVMRSVCVGSLLLLVACENTTNFVSSRPRDDAGMDAETAHEAGTDAGADGSLDWLNDAGRALCGTHVCACSDDKDNDKDGYENGFDSECTGPFDDDEATFALGTERMGGNPKCDDCFYDGNRGADDGCKVATSCSFTGMASNGQGQCGDCTPTALCIDRCKPITPNGCDCFGCCEVRHAGTIIAVRLVGTCSAAEADLSNPSACPRCQLTASACKNPCERCELCPGKTRADLEAEGCAGGMQICAAGHSKCDSSTECKPEEFCTQGCCVPIVY